MIVAPPVVYLGQTFWITVVVVDAGGGTKTGYCGTSSFTSTDQGAKIEGGAMDAYNFVWSSSSSCPAGTDEDGVKLFMGVTMTVLGPQTVVATDTIDGSITGMATVMVVAADVKLTKEPSLQIAASGDTVRFKICWSNCSSATASSFTITDAVPNGTVYAPDSPFNHFCGATKGFGSATVAYSTAATSTGFTTMGGVVPQPPNVTFLRWTIPSVGVMTTGCVCFRVTVN